MMPSRPNGGAEPRHAGVRVASVRRLGRHDVQVGSRSLDPVVERTTRRSDRRRARLGANHRAHHVGQRGIEADARPVVRLLAVAAGDGDRDLDRLARLETQIESQPSGRCRGRRRIAVDDGMARDAVEPVVVEAHAVPASARVGRICPRRARRAPRTSKMSAKSAASGNLERQLETGQPVVRQREPLVTRRFPEELAPQHVQQALRPEVVVGDRDVGVGQVDGKNDTPLLQRGAQ